MEKQTLLDELYRHVSTNDINSCNRIINTMSNSDVKFLVNMVPEDGETIIHKTAKDNVSYEIWKLLVNYADDKTLYESEMTVSAVEMILIQMPNLEEILSKETPKHQLYKIRYWLEMTRDSHTDHVRTLRLHILCELCRLKVSANPLYTSKDEVEYLGKDLISTYNVNINEISSTTGLCPLHWAVLTSNISFICLFLANGANPNCRDQTDDKTPLHLSYRIQGKRNTLQIVTLLIENGASLSEERSMKGYTALHSILISLQPDELDELLTKQPEILQMNNFSLPLPFVHGLMIHSLSESRFAFDLQDRDRLEADVIEKIEVLYNHGLDLNLTDIHGRTILHYACGLRYTNLVAFLRLKNIDLHQKDLFGRSCVHYSVSYPFGLSKFLDENKELSTLMYLDKNMDIYNVYDNLDRTVQNVAIFEKNDKATTYFSRTTSNHFECGPMQEEGIKLFRTLLHDPNIGPLYVNNTVNEIVRNMTEFVHKLADNLKEIDYRFQASVELAGSMSEGTKVNPPDEFDFQFKLSILSQYIDISDFTEMCDVSLHENMVRRDMHLGDLTANCQSLNQGIYTVFTSAIYKILKINSFWNGLPFYLRIFYHSPQILNPLHLKLVGPRHEDINISIDLVPVIMLQKLPPEMKAQIPIDIVNLADDFNLQWSIVVRHSTDARFSFLAVERCILHRLMPEIRMAYIMAKCVRSYMDKLNGVHYQTITSYMLKNALFYELDPGLTYSLIKNNLLPYQHLSREQKYILKLMRENYDCLLKERDRYILDWTVRIYDRLEKWCRKDNRVPIYCRPDVSFLCSIITKDEFGRNPFIWTLQQLRHLLRDK